MVAEYGGFSHPITTLPVPQEKKNLTTREKGNAAELAVLSKLRSLGYNAVLTASYHAPHDIEIRDGQETALRIQVKLAWLNTQRGNYRAQCKRSWKDKDGIGRQTFYQIGDFDFYVAWIAPLNTFYVLPVEQVAGMNAVTFNDGCESQRPSCATPYKEAWGQIAEAMERRSLPLAA